MTAAEFLEARHALGLTQAEMAEALGLSVRQVRRFEKGETISTAVELAVAYLLGCGAS